MEYDEHVEQSQQLEAEMDATIDQKESVIKDLRARISSLEKENEYIKVQISILFMTFSIFIDFG